MLSLLPFVLLHILEKEQISRLSLKEFWKLYISSFGYFSSVWHSKGQVTYWGSIFIYINEFGCVRARRGKLQNFSLIFFCPQSPSLCLWLIVMKGDNCSRSSAKKEDATYFSPLHKASRVAWNTWAKAMKMLTGVYGSPPAHATPMSGQIGARNTHVSPPPSLSTMAAQCLRYNLILVLPRDKCTVRR